MAAHAWALLHPGRRRLSFCVFILLLLRLGLFLEQVTRLPIKIDHVLSILRLSQGFRKQVFPCTVNEHSRGIHDFLYLDASPGSLPRFGILANNQGVCCWQLNRALHKSVVTQRTSRARSHFTDII
jgi:hypothetical protein